MCRATAADQEDLLRGRTSILLVRQLCVYTRLVYTLFSLLTINRYLCGEYKGLVCIYTLVC